MKMFLIRSTVKDGTADHYFDSMVLAENAEQAIGFVKARNQAIYDSVVVDYREMVTYGPGQVVLL